MAFALSSSLDNPEMGAFFASLFRFFNITGIVDTRNQVTQRMRPLMGGEMRDFFAEPTDFCPGFWIGTDNQFQVILIDGVKTNRQAVGLIEGYSVSTGTFSFQGRNPWLTTAANAVRARAASQRTAIDAARQIVVGYSAGGAIAQWVVKLDQPQPSFNDQRFLSFGAPRSMSEADLLTINDKESLRWMNDTDPVPLIPPRFEDATVLALALGVNATLVHGTYIHKNPGFSLAQDGTATLSTLPLVAQTDVTGSLANWYFSKANDPTNTHAIVEYEARLTALRQLQQPPRPAAEARVAPEPAENMNRREHRAAAERTASQVQHASSTQNSVAVNVNAAVLFKAVRFGRIWCVGFGDQIVCFAGNKKRARHLARVGNEFLRSLPKQAVVDPISLVSQFTSFMEAAVLPGGPVTPPINIGL